MSDGETGSVADVGDDDNMSMSGSNGRNQNSEDPSKHTFDSYGGEGVGLVHVPGPDTRLASLFSCLSLTESLFVPMAIDGHVTGTAPPIKQSVSADKRLSEKRRAKDGLYVAWFANGKWRLRVPGTDPAGSWKHYSTNSLEEFRDAIDAFKREWPLIEVDVGKKAMFVAHQRVSDGETEETEGDVLRYPLNEKTLLALKHGTDVRPVDVVFWDMLRGKTTREKDVMRDVMRGERLYTPEVRGDLVRLHNATVLSNTSSDFARLMTCVELMRACSDDVKNSLFVSFGGKHRNISNKDIILYNFCLKGRSIQKYPDSPVADGAKGLKPEQIKAAEDFAKSETKCSLLYWSPGVGKTLGSWAAIVEAAKAEALLRVTDDLTVGVTFLSSGPNLPRDKFIAELRQNVGKIPGVTIVDTEKVEAGRQIGVQKKKSVYPIGWYWEFVLKATVGNVQVTLTFKVVACTYIGFSRGMAMVLFGRQDTQHWFVDDDGLETFLSPKTCDLVLNVCDEAHVLRATTVRELEVSKTKTASSEGITDTAVTELTKMGITNPMSYHVWAWPPKNTRWTKIPWEGLRVEKNAYVHPGLFEIPEKQNRKTLLLTATPFGNHRPHLQNLLTCGLYAANAEDEIMVARERALNHIIEEGEEEKEKEDGEEDQENIDEDEKKEAAAEVDDEVDDEVDGPQKMFRVGAGPGKSDPVVRVLESLLYPVQKSGSVVTPSVRVSVATIDPETAPRQDFGCCHFFSGDGGTIVGPGGSNLRKGGVPWSRDKLLDSTVLRITTKEENDLNANDNRGKDVYDRGRKSNRNTVTNEPMIAAIKKEVLRAEHKYCRYSVVKTEDNESDDTIRWLSRTGLVFSTDKNGLLGQKNDVILLKDVKRIVRHPPRTLIRKIDALYARVRDESRRVVAIDDDVVPTDDPPIDEDNDDDDNRTNQTSKYEDVGVFYWYFKDDTSPLMSLRLSKDVNFQDDGEEDGNDTGGTTENVSRNAQLMRLRNLYVDKRQRTKATVTVKGIDLTDKAWYGSYVAVDKNDNVGHLRTHLRAYSPRYELLFRMLESESGVKNRTAVVLFFERVSGFSLESMEGFRWYADIRNRHRHEDFDVKTDQQHAYWFMRFRDKNMTVPFAYDESKMKESVEKANTLYTALSPKDSASIVQILGPTNTVAACLMFYKEVFVQGSDDTVLKKGVLTRVREIMWEECVEKYEYGDYRTTEDEKKAKKKDFVEHPERHHVVCAVAGEDSNARDWASYLLDESTGAYNHPVNRFGEIVRVMAGADKIGESNDFRSTRHMFFMAPQTDVVKLLQKFGRICRSSDDTKYPYYKYGFHKDHLGASGNEVPIVHYVTLARPAENEDSFANITRKAKFYNAYSRLLARGDGDEGLVVRHAANQNDWRNATHDLSGMIKEHKKFSFDDDDVGVYSNLYGSAEWDWAAKVVYNEDMILGNHRFASPVRDWIVQEFDKEWTWDMLREMVDELFPSTLVPKKRGKKGEDSSEILLDLRAYITNSANRSGPVPTGIVPRLFLNLVIKPKKMSGLARHVLKIVGIVGDKIKDEVQNALRDWFKSCDQWANPDDEDADEDRASRLDALEDVMRDKFSSETYNAGNSETAYDETKPRFAGIQDPFGYTLDDSNSVLMEIREEAAALAADAAKNANGV